MKLLFCRRCGDLVCMRRGVIRECACGNVKGRYAEDNITIEVKFKDMSDARVVGIANDFLAENPLRLDDPLYQNSLFGERKSHIIITFPFTTNDVKYLEI